MEAAGSEGSRVGNRKEDVFEWRPNPSLSARNLLKADSLVAYGLEQMAARYKHYF